MSEKMVNIFNTILSNGSDEYKNYVPNATAENISSVANPILTYRTVQNEFLNALINKVALTIVRKRLLNNPLAALKKGKIELGHEVEEIFTNRAIAQTFDPDGKELLKRRPPDTHVMYHKLNRQDEYPVTVAKETLTQAFNSWDSFNTFLGTLVSTLYDGDSDDEFILMKNLMSDAYKNGHVRTAAIPYMYKADNSVSRDAMNFIVESVKNASSYMGFAGSNFNMYHKINPDKNPLRLKSEPDDQIIVMRADIANTIDVNVLASAFNLDKAQFMAQRVLVDNFGDSVNIGMLICDKDFFQVYDKLRTTEEFFNPHGLYWTYFYHVWQIVSYSLMCNAMFFAFEPIALTVNNVTANSTEITGTTVEGAKVVAEVNGNVIGETVVQGGENFSITITKQKKDTEIKVISSAFGEIGVKTVIVGG